MKYRKKPVEIEARQLTPENHAEIALWVGGNTWHYTDPEDKELYIETLEGTMLARDGDFIIRGVQGEFYPCKPDIFAKTYEPVEFEVVLDEPTPPFPEIPQELLDDPYFKMLTVGNSTIFEGTNP